MARAQTAPFFLGFRHSVARIKLARIVYRKLREFADRKNGSEPSSPLDGEALTASQEAPLPQTVDAEPARQTADVDQMVDPVAAGLLHYLARRGWHLTAQRLSNQLNASFSSPGEGDELEARLKPDETRHKVLGLFGDTILSSMHFHPLSDPVEKKIAFKNAVRYIDIEAFSQCNRRCHYCSNAVLDRLTTNQFMDEGLFARILADLEEIAWDGQLRFIGLNEPLMHREFIIARIRQAHRSLPRAVITLFTNGDYLTRDYLDELYDAGVRQLYISVHLAPYEPFDDKKILTRIDRLCDKLGVEYRIDRHVQGVDITGSLSFKDMVVTIFQRDYENVGHDRGGILEGIGRQDFTRKSGCIVPVQMMVIGYNGNVLPCNHFVGDAEQHKSLVVGRLTSGNSIFDVYASKRYVSWRQDLFRLGEKDAACAKCVDYDDSAILNDPRVFAACHDQLQNDASTGSHLAFAADAGGSPLEAFRPVVAQPEKA